VDRFKNMKVEHGCDFLFFCSGRLDPSKNLARVIRAFARIDTSVNYKFVIAGNGPLKEYLSRKISAIGMGSRIQLVGFISDDDLVAYLNSADVIVYLPINEPFGLVPIEAMACGKPSLVSSTGGPSETVIDGKTGFHANSLDVEDIAKKIEFILSHPEDLLRMRKSCKDRYEKEYTLSAGVARFLDRLLK
jgi:glycosyltransferase involved in cell wall biosynthesis